MMNLIKISLLLFITFYLLSGCEKADFIPADLLINGEAYQLENFGNSYSVYAGSYIDIDDNAITATGRNCDGQYTYEILLFLLKQGEYFSDEYADQPVIDLYLKLYAPLETFTQLDVRVLNYEDYEVNRTENVARFYLRNILNQSQYSLNGTIRLDRSNGLFRLNFVSVSAEAAEISGLISFTQDDYLPYVQNELIVDNSPVRFDRAYYRQSEHQLILLSENILFDTQTGNITGNGVAVRLNVTLPAGENWYFEDFTNFPPVDNIAYLKLNNAQVTPLDWEAISEGSLQRKCSLDDLPRIDISLSNSARDHPVIFGNYNGQILAL